jgi:hypothetical protein
VRERAHGVAAVVVVVVFAFSREVEHGGSKLQMCWGFVRCAPRG